MPNGCACAALVMTGCRLHSAHPLLMSRGMAAAALRRAGLQALTAVRDVSRHTAGACSCPSAGIKWQLTRRGSAAPPHTSLARQPMAICDAVLMTAHPACQVSRTVPHPPVPPALLPGGAVGRSAARPPALPAHASRSAAVSQPGASLHSAWRGCRRLQDLAASDVSVAWPLCDTL